MSNVKKLAVGLVAVCSFAGEASAQRIALTGTVITPQKITRSGRVVIDGNTIVCAGTSASCRAASVGATVVKTGLDLFAGFVDAHNHVSWNFLPFARFAKPTFNNRYNWRFGDPVFTAAQRAKSAAEKLVGCDLTRYGEVMAALGGATTIVSEDKCFGDGIRNGEQPDLGGPAMRTVGDPLQLRGASKTMWDAALASPVPPVARFVIHLAEGRDASSLNEFNKLEAMGAPYTQNRITTVIHGVPAGATEFARLASRGWSMVWSPSSNMRLYQATTNVMAAASAGVNVALAPDWNLGGSPTIVQELGYVRMLYPSGPAREFLSGQRLLHMVTTGAATAIGLQRYIGTLAPGFRADIVGVRRATGVTNPYENLAAATPRAVELVIVDGRAVVKAPTTALKAMPTQGPCELVDACGKARAVCTSYSVTQMAARVRAAYPAAAPLADCAPRPLQ